MLRTDARSPQLLAFASILLGFFVMAFLAMATHAHTFGDEWAHADRIRSFMQGNFDLGQASAGPGYHLLTAAISNLVGTGSIVFFRFVTFVLGLLSIVVVYRLLLALGSKTPLARTAQYAFNAIVFPFFFLTYTDVPSLFAVLVALLLAMKRRYVPSAIAAVCSIVVRQTNILWLVFLGFVFLWQEWTAIRRKSLRPSLVISCVLLGLGCAAFLAFVITNGGVALGDAGAHPFPSFHTGNIFFALFLAFFLYLPLHLWNLPAILAMARGRPFLVAGSMTAAVVLYVLTFDNLHGYHSDLNLAHIRNIVLTAATATPGRQALFFLPIALTVLSLLRTRLSQRFFLLLYPWTALFLSFSWLIEQRYYFIPFTLFLLFREELEPRREWTLAIYSCVLCMLVFVPVALRIIFI